MAYLGDLQPVASRALPAVLAGIRAGRPLVLPTYTRITIIDARCLAKWEAAGLALLREEGEGYRLRVGKKSVYVFPGQFRQASGQ